MSAPSEPDVLARLLGRTPRGAFEVVVRGPAGEPLVLVSVLKGAMVFVSDLMRAIPQ